MKRLYKTTAIMGVSTFAAMLAGLIRAKFLAVTLGPSGVGIFSQAMTFLQSAETICGLGISVGVTKYIAEMRHKKERQGIITTVASFFTLQGLSFGVFFALILLFSKRISGFIFSSPDYAPYLILASMAVFFSVLITSMETALLGLSRPDSFSRARILYYFLGLGVLMISVGLLKLKGGFFYFLINAVLSFAVVSVFLVKALKEKASVFLRDVAKAVRRLDYRSGWGKLLSYGAVMLVSSAFSWLAILYVRSLVISRLGANFNGFYQVVFALTGYYTPFFTNAVWGYLFPKLSAAGNTKPMSLEVNRTLRFTQLFLVPLIAVLFIFRKAFVVTVFSEEFLPSLSIFPLYLTGSFFYMLVYIVGTPLLAQKKLKAYFSVNILHNALYAGLFTALVSVMGFRAIPFSYLLANAAALLAFTAYIVKRMGIKIEKKNLKLFAFSVFFLAFILLVPWEGVSGVSFKGMCAILWIFLATGKRERALLRSIAREKIPWMRSRL